MQNELFRRRFQELQEISEALPVVQGSMPYIPTKEWHRWATSCQSLIKAVFGDESPHYTNFTNTLGSCSGYKPQVEALQGLFESANSDYEGGYVFNVELRISGEIFGDFVVLAKESLANGHVEVASVLATASLEDSLKRYAETNNLETDSRTMTEVISALKSKGLVSGATKTLLDAMPRIRNAAMHAQWDRISEPDVNSVIGFVEQFLLTRFSPV